MTSPVRVSIVVPVYAGEKYLSGLFNEIAALRAKWQSGDAPLAVSELIFVDDGAIDKSPEILDELAAAEGWVTVLHMSRNFGQHPATIAGILHCSGDWVVTMDEDLQHPPSAIPLLLQKAAETHADVVYANGQGDIHESAIRDLSSRTYKRMIEWMTGNRSVRQMNSFRLIRGAIARAASSACIHDTYFDVALAWYTKRFEIVEIDLKDERYIQTGKSGYNLRSLFSHARRLLVSSNLKFLRASVIFGFFMVCASISISILLVLLHIFDIYKVEITGWTSIIVTVNLLGGITIFLLGILLEYVSILLQRVHGRPLFFVLNRSSDGAIKDYFGSHAP
jgi:glycosyltransferase involved in cell wall biosynthesis